MKSFGETIKTFVQNIDYILVKFQIVIREGLSVKWIIGLQTNLEPRVRWFDPLGREISLDMRKFSLIYNADDTNENKILLMCIIYDIDINDMGEYTLQVYNVKEHTETILGHLKMSLFVKAKPQVTMVNSRSSPNGLVFIGVENQFQCHVRSFPIVNTRLTITYHPCGDQLDSCKVNSNGTDSLALPFYSELIGDYTVSRLFYTLH